MNRLLTALAFITLILVSSCAHGTKAIITPDARLVRRVYVWDADGSIDLKLLHALKAQTARQMKQKGLIISDDSRVTDAYVKITVVDAIPGGDSGKSFLKARLYLINAVDSSIMYDKTAEFSKPDKGYEGPDYPVEETVGELINELPGQ